MMARNRSPEDLTEQELRRLLLDKRRVSRRERIDRFRQTGRALNLAPDLPGEDEESWHLLPGSLPEEIQPAIETPKTRRRRLADRILLGVEVLAILALAGILINGLGLLRTLNREVAAALQLSTLEPTPLITAVILPSGHTPPTSADGGQENKAEIPAHLMPLVEAQAALPIPTSGPEQAIRIQVPAIDVDMTIVQGDGWEQLKKGVGQHIGTPNPGQPGNLVLAGHNDVYGEVFRNLDRLKPGDAIILFTIKRQYIYLVSGSQVVEPTQVEVLAPTSEPTVTLISCYPYLVDSRRIVVFASLQNP